MKLIVQIPCFNEAATIARTIGDIPRAIDGVARVEVLVVDDGSTDGTAEAARAAGADQVVVHKRNLGLARAFEAGIDACLARGADIIVNTDGDNQYAGADVARLIRPILDGAADIVIGDRQTETLAHFSGTKKLLQRLGSATVRRLSGLDVPDTVSGFRAYSREAALALNVISDFSYTVETILQAGTQRLTVASVPVRTNPTDRPSRLYRGVPHFIARQVNTLVRMYAMYWPLRAFSAIGLVLLAGGAVPILRFLYFFFVQGNGSGHVQSLVLGGVLVTLGFITLVIALTADLIGWNRKLLERTLERVRRLELAQEQGRAKQEGEDAPPAETSHRAAE